MSKKEFQIFEDNRRRLDLIRVVDNLICGHKATVLLLGDSSFGRVSSHIVQESFNLAAQCTNYMPPYQRRLSIQMGATVAKLVDLSMSFGAVSVRLPQSRFNELNSVFSNIVSGINQIAGGQVVELAHAPYLPLLSNRYDYDEKTPSMFSEGARGIWAFQEHREVA